MYVKDLVSIIIPFHNAERYAETCLNCLESQLYQNYEAIFVDDGSDDKTCDIIRGRLNTRVQLISIPKSGVSTARNVGLEKAKGEYVTFWDIDDIPHPDFVSTFVEDIRTYKVDTVISNYEDVFAADKHVKITLPWKNQVITREEIEDVLIPRMIYPLKNEEAIKGLVWRTFTRTEVICGNKLFFDPDLSRSEDFLFTIELYRLCNSIYVEDKSLYSYIQNSISTVNTYSEDYIDSNLVFHKRFVNKLKELGLYNKNRYRYEGRRLGMYSVCISNCVRNGIVHADALTNIKRLRTLLLEDKIEIIYSMADIKVKVACCLLILKMYRPLIVIYALKEKRRIAKFDR